MLLLWNQWIDENAAALNFKSGKFVFVCVSRRACFSQSLLGVLSLLKHHLFIWHSLLSVTGRMRNEACKNKKHREVSPFLLVCGHKHHRSTASSTAKSFGSSNLWWITDAIIHCLPEGLFRLFNKHNRHCVVWNCHSGVWCERIKWSVREAEVSPAGCSD